MQKDFLSPRFDISQIERYNNTASTLTLDLHPPGLWRFCGLSQLIYSVLLWQPWQTNTVGKLRSKPESVPRPLAARQEVNAFGQACLDMKNLSIGDCLQEVFQSSSFVIPSSPKGWALSLVILLFTQATYLCTTSVNCSYYQELENIRFIFPIFSFPILFIYYESFESKRGREQRIL